MDRETRDLSVSELTFNDQGLIPVIAQQYDTGEVLMLAWMNAESIARTIETGRAWYWSRSRQAYWMKGESSGHVQEVKALRYDCDADALLLLVDQSGPACHTNQRSCFYRALFPAPEPGVAAAPESTDDIPLS